MPDPTSNPITGGCLCGAVRYAITAEPLFGGKCYCDDCRRSGSSGHCAVIAYPETAVAVTGTMASFTKPGGSGKPITRHFCPTCGSQITASGEAFPGAVMVRASTLDDPEVFQCQASVYASRAPSWDKPQPGIPTFDEAPPQRS